MADMDNLGNQTEQETWLPAQIEKIRLQERTMRITLAARVTLRIASRVAGDPHPVASDELSICSGAGSRDKAVPIFRLNLDR